jgi:hypothetical protein
VPANPVLADFFAKSLPGRYTGGLFRIWGGEVFIVNSNV